MVLENMVPDNDDVIGLFDPGPELIGLPPYEKLGLLVGGGKVGLGLLLEPGPRLSLRLGSTSDVAVISDMEDWSWPLREPDPRISLRLGSISDVFVIFDIETWSWLPLEPESSVPLMADCDDAAELLSRDCGLVCCDVGLMLDCKLLKSEYACVERLFWGVFVGEEVSE